jgi:hypothetical protein
VLSEYEKRALAQIHAWKNPEQTWYDTAMAYVNKPLELAGQAVDKIPGFTDTCTKAMNGVIGLVNERCISMVGKAARNSQGAFGYFG